ncbi:MAG: NucA/NucB deoxyribonuclease domain-containing protein [Flavobacterium sp.]
MTQIKLHKRKEEKKHYKVLRQKARKDCKEMNIPYASITEGGKGADVAYDPASENSSQGGSLSVLYSSLNSGDAFLVVPVPDVKEPETVPQKVPEGFPDYSKQRRPSISPKDVTAGVLIGAGGLYIGWQIVKWTAAALAAPETGGLLLGATGTL